MFSFIYSPTLTSIHDYWKNHRFDLRWTLSAMSLFFNMLSRLVKAMRRAWCEELTYLKRPWCWERLRAGGEGNERGRGWMASLTRWTWVWVDSGSCRWTGRPGMPGVAKSQTQLSDWTELRLVIAFHPRGKSLLILGCSHHRQWFGAQEKKICFCFHFFPIYLPWSDGTGCYDLRF